MTHQCSCLKGYIPHWVYFSLETSRKSVTNFLPDSSDCLFSVFSILYKFLPFCFLSTVLVLLTSLLSFFWGILYPLQADSRWHLAEEAGHLLSLQYIKQILRCLSTLCTSISSFLYPAQSSLFSLISPLHAVCPKLCFPFSHPTPFSLNNFPPDMQEICLILTVISFSSNCALLWADFAIQHFLPVATARNCSPVVVVLSPPLITHWPSQAPPISLAISSPLLLSSSYPDSVPWPSRTLSWLTSLNSFYSLPIS